MRQSLLTYYFPTRLDLLTAVSRVAVDGRLKALDALLEVTSPAVAVVRHQDTWVLMALAQAADTELPIREVFREFAAGIYQRFGKLLEHLGVRPPDEHQHLLHALSVGLAVVDLATGREDGVRIAAGIMEAALTRLSPTESANDRSTGTPRTATDQAKMKLGPHAQGE